MASLRKLKNSPYWIACISLPDGRQTQRSTKTTNRQDALRIALAMEAAGAEARKGRLTESAARRAVAEIYRIGNGDNLPSSTVREYLTAWLERVEVEKAASTHDRYSNHVNQLLGYLGKRADMDIAHLTRPIIAEFRDHIARVKTASTANHAVKVLGAALNQAKRDGLVDQNPASMTTPINEGEKQERKPFTLDEVRRLVDVASDEWKGIILFGLYSGQRLGDIALLTWSNVDLQRAETYFVIRKNNRRITVPIAEPLMSYLECLPAGDDPDAPLFPRAHAKVQKSGKVNTLSNEFHKIKVSAGMAEKRTWKSTGKGRHAERTRDPLTFHSLRHTAVSLFRDLGVPEAVVMEIVGHSSKAVSRHYTHVGDESKRKAVSQMPDIFAH